jgi:hypothetical protein
MGLKIALMYNTLFVVPILSKSVNIFLYSFYFVTSSRYLVKYHILYITMSSQLSISSSEVQHIYEFSCLTNCRLCHFFVGKVYIRERRTYLFIVLFAIGGVVMISWSYSSFFWFRQKRFDLIYTILSALCRTFLTLLLTLHQFQSLVFLYVWYNAPFRVLVMLVMSSQTGREEKRVDNTRRIKTRVRSDTKLQEWLKFV